MRVADEADEVLVGGGVAPAFDTKSVSSKRRKTQLDKESKDLLKSINHEGLLKRIKQKVEASGGVVIVTSEAFTTKTCSRCGHHRTVGRARIYSCTKCKAVMDRDGNAAMNILRDTLLRILEHHSQHKSTAQTSQVVQRVINPGHVPNASGDPQGFSVENAADVWRSDTLETMKALMTDDRIDVNADNDYLFRFSVFYDRTYMVEALLKDPRIDPRITDQELRGDSVCEERRYGKAAVGR
ncbi:hypothetical protein HDU96_004557 [Phlyctochytrium bullatum]|nr:hypothetical protein HDU96_004557 [Phlyctochytrium bullatum]